MSKEELYEKLRHDLVKFSNSREKKHFYYECFIDFDENFDGIYTIINDLDLPYQLAFDLCLGFLCRMDAYYDSPAYIEDLNKALSNTNI